MAKTKADSWTRLLQAEEKTTDQYCFGNAAIADIAKEARIPLGNVYYSCKTKDEIGNAIVELRFLRFRWLLQNSIGRIRQKSGCARSCESRTCVWNLARRIKILANSTIQGTPRFGGRVFSYNRAKARGSFRS